MAHPISGGSDTDVDEPLVDQPPVEETPAPPPVPPVPDEAARLREENARLRGQVDVLSTRPAAPPPPPPVVDPIAAEYETIERDFAAGNVSEAARTMRLGQLGARSELARHAREERETQARTREEHSRQRGNHTIGGYIEKYPSLRDPNSPEMARVMPALRAVSEEFDWPIEDPRAQALALERTYGPLTRSPLVDTREFERRRHPGGGGGGTYTDEPPGQGKPKSKGQDVWDRLTKTSQDFFVAFRGSKEAAIKTLEHADEEQFRQKGRFR
jgi:hypothetical protein